jgi:predicted helicase
METKCGERTTQSAIFPLYVYPDATAQGGLGVKEQKTHNLKKEIVLTLSESLGLLFVDEKASVEDSFCPLDVLDYIYAVLYSSKYRDKYSEFLKVDFPRVPYPKDQKTFWQLVDLGEQIRKLHLLESEQTENYITSYPEGGDNIVTRKMSKNSIGYEATDKTLGKVWINDIQYFYNVPLVAWEFLIGGYQPAQKWLKDRKERELSFEDILHYQKIIVALSETDRLMKEIDKIEIE